MRPPLPTKYIYRLRVFALIVDRCVKRAAWRLDLGKEIKGERECVKILSNLLVCYF